MEPFTSAVNVPEEPGLQTPAEKQLVVQSSEPVPETKPTVPILIARSPADTFIASIDKVAEALMESLATNVTSTPAFN